jgi:hypothetical protein
MTTVDVEVDAIEVDLAIVQKLLKIHYTTTTNQRALSPSETYKPFFPWHPATAPICGLIFYARQPPQTGQ